MSGSTNTYVTMKRGAAADLEVHLPFVPGVVRMYVDDAGTLEVGIKTWMMSGDTYLSTTSGTDAGVTINGTVLEIANDADINVDDEDITIIAEDNFQDE
jgi:hypothetical protein